MCACKKIKPSPQHLEHDLSYYAEQFAFRYVFNDACPNRVENVFLQWSQRVFNFPWKSGRHWQIREILLIYRISELKTSLELTLQSFVLNIPGNVNLEFTTFRILYSKWVINFLSRKIEKNKMNTRLTNNMQIILFNFETSPSKNTGNFEWH